MKKVKLNQLMVKKFGIVGCGHIANRHIKHITNHKLGEVIGVFDVDFDKAHSFGDKYQVPVFSSLSELLLATPDVVNVCTPNGAHAQVAKEVLNAGIHVVIEKPMTLSVADAEMLNALADEKNLKLFVVKQNRYNPPVTAVKQLIDQGKLGKVYMVMVNGFWNRNEAYYSQTNWRGTQSLDGGVLFTQFSHFVDILYYLFGDIEQVKGQMANLGHQHQIEIEDTGNFTFLLKKGGLGSFNYTTCSHEQNMEGSITVFAENATIKIGGKYLNTIDYQNTKGFDIEHIEMSNKSNNYGFYEGSMSNHDYVIDNVIKTLNHQAEVMTNGYEGKTVVEMINKFYSAAKN